MSTGRQIQQVHVESCLPAPIRRSLDNIARNTDIIVPLTSGAVSPDLNINIENLYANEGDTFPTSVTSASYKVGTLNADLGRDATVAMTTVDSKVVNVYGYFVKSGYKIPSGSRVGARSYKGVWYVDVTDTCLVVA